MVSHDTFKYVEYNMSFVKQTKCTPIGTYYIQTLCKNRKKTLNNKRTWRLEDIHAYNRSQFWANWVVKYKFIEIEKYKLSLLLYKDVYESVK
jgi:hypothetical protein